MAVEEEIARFTAATGIAVAADVAALTTLPAALGEQAARVIAEGLSNVARHAQARHVWVRAVARRRTMEIAVGDDGVGFDLGATVGRAGHYGLISLRERARLSGGDLEIASAPGRGTTLHLSLPSANHAALAPATAGRSNG